MVTSYLPNSLFHSQNSAQYLHGYYQCYHDMRVKNTVHEYIYRLIFDRKRSYSPLTTLAASVLSSVGVEGLLPCPVNADTRGIERTLVRNGWWAADHKSFSHSSNYLSVNNSNAAFALSSMP